MTQMSDLNNFLWDIQEIYNPGGRKYACYGDSAFREVRACIFSRHYPQPGVPLTARQIAENNAMTAVRQSIEFGFGLLSLLWRVCDVKSNWKIFSERSYAKEQLRVTYIFTNIYTCLNSSVVNSSNGFDCATPSLEDYLV